MDPAILRPAVNSSTGAARAEAFRGLAELHLAASYRLALAILHDEADAEDATHDAFVTAWSKWSSLRDPARFDRWFQKILVNTCRNRLRQASRRVVRDISDLVVADETRPTIDERETLAHAFRQLSADDRIVLALRYDRDLMVDDIALVLSIPSGTVKSRLHNALIRLRRVIERPNGKGRI